jgi:hypothetical protein
MLSSMLLQLLVGLTILQAGMTDAAAAAGVGELLLCMPLLLSPSPFLHDTWQVIHSNHAKDCSRRRCCCCWRSICTTPDGTDCLTEPGAAAAAAAG